MKIADNVPIIKFDLSQTDIIIIVPLIYSHVEDNFFCLHLALHYVTGEGYDLQYMPNNSKWPLIHDCPFGLIVDIWLWIYIWGK